MSAAGMLTRRAVAQRPNSVNVENRTLEAVVSTDEIDSFGDVVSQDWRLDRYLANPTVLLSHDTASLPIGSASNLRVVAGPGGRQQLECTIRLASRAANEMAERALQLLAEGHLRGISAGFVPSDVHVEKRDGRDVMVLGANTLFEISICAMPANASALVKSVDALARTRPTVASEPVEPPDVALLRAIDERAAGQSPAEHVVSLDETRSAPVRATARDRAELAATAPLADDEFDLRLLGLDETGPQPITRDPSPHPIGADLVELINEGSA